MSSPEIPLVYVDLASTLLKLAFELIEKSGATTEQQAQFFEQELARFNERNPEGLPDVSK